MNIKIQSISDIITNSSTEVFVLYALHNKTTIKKIVNAILAIDGNYTFDDLFTIHMTINEYVLCDIYQDSEDLQKEYESEDTFLEYVKQASDSELLELEYEFEEYNIFDGYRVFIKENVISTETLETAKNLLNTLDSIFDITYSWDR